MLASCLKREDYPDSPQLSYNGFSIEQSNGTRKGVLTLSFTDGDGNVGSKSGDTLPNLYLYPYFNIGGTFRLDTLDGYDEPINFNGMIPNLSIPGSKKEMPQKGDINYTFDLDMFDLAPSKTIYFECWITDQNGAASNHVQTPVLNF